MDQPEPDITPTPSLTPDESQKLIHKILRFSGIGFLALGIIVLLTGGGIILGSALTLIGITDLILMPHIIETIILAKLKQRNKED